MSGSPPNKKCAHVVICDSFCRTCVVHAIDDRILNVPKWRLVIADIARCLERTTLKQRLGACVWFAYSILAHGIREFEPLRYITIDSPICRPSRATWPPLLNKSALSGTQTAQGLHTVNLIPNLESIERIPKSFIGVGSLKYGLVKTSITIVKVETVYILGSRRELLERFNPRWSNC